MKINYAVPVKTCGGCHMYYGLLNDGNWFFLTDAWDYGYITSCSPQSIMWDDDFEEKIEPIKVKEVCDDDFDILWHDLMMWLVDNGFREFVNY